MSYSNHYYKCGCFVRDVDEGLGVKIIFSKCTKHSKEFKRCEWLTWAKKMAPAQYRDEIKDNRKDRGWKI